jgi:hypothetical protein
MSRVLSTTESLCVASSTSLQEKHMFCTNIPKSITEVFKEVVKINQNVIQITNENNAHKIWITQGAFTRHAKSFRT